MKAQILLATFNPPPGLFTRQIRSLLNQTERDWQCLVYDDGSSNRAPVDSMLSDSRFRILPSREHLGPYRAYDYLIREAQDVPLFLCDQDDSWQERKIEIMLQRPGSAFSAMRVTDVRGRVVRSRFLPAPAPVTPAGLLMMNCVSGAAMKITPQVRKAALPFPAPGLRGWHDQWLAAVAARLGDLTYIDIPLVDYTQHPGQVVGYGSRRITVRRLKKFLQQPALRSRTVWVMSAARRLLELPGDPDPDLEAIARGRFGEVRGRHSVPRQRSVLLNAGRWV